jgi:hypothetical protein
MRYGAKLAMKNGASARLAKRFSEQRKRSCSFGLHPLMQPILARSRQKFAC